MLDAVATKETLAASLSRTDSVGMFSRAINMNCRPPHLHERPSASSVVFQSEPNRRGPVKSALVSIVT